MRLEDDNSHNIFLDELLVIEDVLAAAVKRMKWAKHNLNSISIQFVQIGSDQIVKEVLEKLVYGKNGVC